jgi:hypothetical protein
VGTVDRRDRPTVSGEVPSNISAVFRYSAVTFMDVGKLFYVYNVIV